jgi:hypothetical protein
MSAAAGGAGAGEPPLIDWLKSLTFSIADKDPPMFEITTEEGKKREVVTREVVMVEAKFSDDTVFWRQPFYRSSGTSSRQENTWFPFLGINETAFVKGDAVPGDWPSNDRLYAANQLGFDENSLKRRSVAYSFLVASNNLQKIDTTLIDRLSREVNNKILLEQVVKNVLTERVELDIDTPRKKIEKIRIKSSTADADADADADAQYATINNWIGTDIYINYGRTDDKITAAERADPGYAMMRMKAEIEAKKAAAAAAAAAAGAGASGGRRRRTQKRRRHGRNHRSNRKNKSKSNHNRRTARRQR